MAGCSAMLLGDGQTGKAPADDVNERAAAQNATDQAITRAVRSALAADKHAGQYGLGVSTYGGKVKLSGTVGSFEARDQAVAIARGVDGVTSVSNQIRVDTRQ